MLPKTKKEIREKAHLDRRNRLAVEIRAGMAKARTVVVDAECAIFALAVVGGDGNKATAYEKLRAMTPAERRHIRESVERLDGILDQVALDIHLERSKSKTKGGTSKV
jgi:hypothetical protein